MPNCGLCRSSPPSHQGALTVVLGGRHGGDGGGWLRGPQSAMVVVGLGMDAVQMLRDSDTATVQQEVRQEVSVCVCGQRMESQSTMRGGKIKLKN